MEVCCKQMAWLLDNCWIRPSRASHAASATVMAAGGPGPVAEVHVSSAVFPSLTCMCGSLQVGDQRCKIKVLHYSGATDCFVSPRVALRWPHACGQLASHNPQFLYEEGQVSMREQKCGSLGGK